MLFLLFANKEMTERLRHFFPHKLVVHHLIPCLNTDSQIIASKSLRAEAISYCQKTLCNKRKATPHFIGFKQKSLCWVSRPADPGWASCSSSALLLSLSSSSRMCGQPRRIPAMERQGTKEGKPSHPSTLQVFGHLPPADILLAKARHVVEPQD